MRYGNIWRAGEGGVESGGVQSRADRGVDRSAQGPEWRGGRAAVERTRGEDRKGVRVPDLRVFGV